MYSQHILRASGKLKGMGKMISDEDTISALLAGMSGEKYATIIDMIITKENLTFGKASMEISASLRRRGLDMAVRPSLTRAPTRRNRDTRKSIVQAIGKNNRPRKGKNRNPSDGKGASKGKPPKTVDCYICGGNHYARDCPDRRTKPEKSQHLRGDAKEDEPIEVLFMMRGAKIIEEPMMNLRISVNDSNRARRVRWGDSRPINLHISVQGENRRVQEPQRLTIHLDGDRRYIRRNPPRRHRIIRRSERRSWRQRKEFRRHPIVQRRHDKKARVQCDKPKLAVPSAPKTTPTVQRTTDTKAIEQANQDDYIAILLEFEKVLQARRAKAEQRLKGIAPRQKDHNGEGEYDPAKAGEDSDDNLDEKTLQSVSMLSSQAHSRNSSTAENKSTFVVDSGATQHVFKEKRYFVSMKPCKSRYILLGDHSSRMPVLGTGIVHIPVPGHPRPIRLTNVAYCPKAAENFIAGKKALRDDGYQRRLAGDSDRLQITDGKQIVATSLPGDAVLDRFDISPNHVPSRLYAQLDDKSRKEQYGLHRWHLSLVHSSLRKIRKMLRTHG
mmetsp:Transcript_23605/g.35360  ORF Transcript_23605/g.35360 Transcript_23605/m.35360 type:complete len:555 (+) Transcript_23605:1751-3415(+)